MSLVKIKAPEGHKNGNPIKVADSNDWVKKYLSGQPVLGAESQTVAASEPALQRLLQAFIRDMKTVSRKPLTASLPCITSLQADRKLSVIPQLWKPVTILKEP